MPLETAPFVADLVATNPANSDNVQQGSDHLRLIKAALVATLPTFNAPITATPAQINEFNTRTTELEARNPVGIPQIWLMDTAPAGWLVLQGQAVSRAAYPLLFALYGTTFGAGDWTTTFNLPDFRLRFLQGAGTGDALRATGGTTAPAVTVASSGAHTHGVWAAGSHTHGVDGSGGHSHGGATAGHALTWGQMAQHNHGVNDPGHSHGGIPATAFLSTVGFSGNVSGWGGNTSALPYSNITIDPAGTGISIQHAGNNEAHAHGIWTDGHHAHSVHWAGEHSHTVDWAGEHSHTATVANTRPPYLNVNFIVRGV